MTTHEDLIVAEEQRIARYFEATPEEREEMRRQYKTQILGELAAAQIQFEAEE